MMLVCKRTGTIKVPKHIFDRLYGRFHHHQIELLSIFHKHNLVLLEDTLGKLDVYNEFIFQLVGAIVKVLGERLNILVENFVYFVVVENSILNLLLQDVAVEEIVLPVFGEDYVPAVLLNKQVDDRKVLMK